MNNSSQMDRGIVPVKPHSSSTITGLFFFSCFRNLPRPLMMYFLLTAKPLWLMWLQIRPLLSKKCQQHLCGPAGMDLYLYKTWLPIYDLLHGLFLVSVVWWHTKISSMVTILSNIVMGQRWTVAIKPLQVWTLSSFCSEFKSFVTHLVDFFSSPKSL